VPGWLGRILVTLVLTQAATFLARPVTSYRALALGADERVIGLITASFAVIPLVVAVPLGRVADRDPGAETGRPMRATDIVRAPGVPAGMFASVAILAAVDIITAYLPVIGERSGIGPAVVGALLSLRAAASILSRLRIPPMVRALGRVRLIAVSAAGSALAWASCPPPTRLPPWRWCWSWPGSSWASASL
jgi:hypothetical protein